MAFHDRSTALATRYPSSDVYRHDEYPQASHPRNAYHSPPETRPISRVSPEVAHRSEDVPPLDYMHHRRHSPTPPHEQPFARATLSRHEREPYRIDYRAPPASRPSLPNVGPFPTWSDGYERQQGMPMYTPAYRDQEYYDHGLVARRPLLPAPSAARYVPYPERRLAPIHPQRPVSRTMEEERRQIALRQPPMYESAQRRLPPLVRPDLARHPRKEEIRPSIPATNTGSDKKRRRIQLQCYIMYRPTRCLWGDCTAILDCWSKLEKHIWHAHLAPGDAKVAPGPRPECKWEGCHYRDDTAQEVYKHALVPHMKQFSARCPFNCLFEGSDFQALMDHIERRHPTCGPDDFVPGLIHHRPKLEETKLPALPTSDENDKRIILLTNLALPHVGVISRRSLRMVHHKSISGKHPRKEDFLKKQVAGAVISACLDGRRQSKQKDDIDEDIRQAILTTKRKAKNLEGPSDEYSSVDTETSSRESDGSAYDSRPFDLESEEGVVTRCKSKRAVDCQSLQGRNNKRPRSTSPAKVSPRVSTQPEPVAKTESVET